MKEIDLGQEEVTKIVCGSHNRIIIEKLYGPTCVPDLHIVWEGSDWNVRNKNAELRKLLHARKTDSDSLPKPLESATEIHRPQTKPDRTVDADETSTLGGVTATKLDKAVDIPSSTNEVLARIEDLKCEMYEEHYSDDDPADCRLRGMREMLHAIEQKLFTENRKEMDECKDCKKLKRSYCLKHTVIDSYLRTIIKKELARYKEALEK